MPPVSEVLEEAKTQHRAGQLATAFPLYQWVLQADPTHFEAHYLLGAVLHLLGQINDAIVHLEQSIRLRPELTDAQNHLGSQ